MNQLVRRFFKISKNKGVKIALIRSLDHAYQNSIHKLLSTFIFPTQTYQRASHLWYGSKLRSVDEYEIPINPLKRRTVNPNDINYVTEFSGHCEQKSRPQTVRNQTLNRMNLIGNVAGGNWDVKNNQFDSHSMYTSMKNHFEEGIPWEETEFIKNVVRKVEQGKLTWHGCSTHEEISSRTKYIDKLYQQIKRSGYKDQTKTNPRESYPRELTNEVLIDIGRDGELLFVNGRHRLSIAQILDLDTIPVTVRVRHKKWMERIESDYRTDTLPTHPDLKYIQK